MVRKSNRTFENIRTKVCACDTTTGDMLESRPPFSLELDLVDQPVRDGLLADSAVVADELRNARGELGLSTRDLDRSPQSGDMRLVHSNVTFLHDHRLYKRTCDYVNKYTGVTPNKAACKVLYMAVLKRKPAFTPSLKPAKKPFPVGADQKTANQRLRETLESHSTIQRETDLWRACNQLLGKVEGDRGFVRQQSISNFLRDKDSLDGSKHLPVIAEALGIRAFWLQTGLGERLNRSEAILKEILERHGLSPPS